MEQALGTLLPIGVAAALSSVPITAVILILLSDKRSHSALPFLLGWVFGTLLLVSVGTIAASSIPKPRPRHADTTTGVLEILLGAALVALSLRAMLHRRAAGAGQSSRWTKAISSLGPVKSLGVGLALNLRPKGLILSATASLALHSAKLGVRESAILVVLYTAVATSTVAIPVVATLASPHRMEPRLIEARDWLDEHGYVVTATITLLIGVIILGAGIAKL